jgi:hypothetical protein
MQLVERLNLLIGRKVAAVRIFYALSNRSSLFVG